MIVFDFEDFKIREDENGYFFAEYNPSSSEVKVKEIFNLINYLNQPERSKREESLMCTRCNRKEEAFRCVHCDHLNYQ